MKGRSLSKSLVYYWGNFSRLCFVLGLFIVLFGIIWKQKKEKCKCCKMEDPEFMDTDRKKTINLEDIIWKMPENPHFSVVKNALGPLPIPYKYLLGSPPSKKRFLMIGISSVYKEKEQHLLKTIESIFSHCSPEELRLFTLVIYLANNDSQMNDRIAKEIEAQFSTHVSVGRLLVIQSSLSSYPPLSKLRVNSWDNEENVGAQAKQNVDYAYLVNFCASLSQYYLMLEDDIVCATNFVSIIHSYVKYKKGPWTTTAFSRQGYIGKLYRRSDLTKLARFLLMFYNEMPADWLLEFFHKANAQEDAIIFRPSLFQHVGRISSFHSMKTELKDTEFEEDPADFGDSPPASCFTNIPIFLNYVPDNVCPPWKGVFWGKNVTSESFFTIVFTQPVVPQKIQICTGSAEYNRDILHHGYVEKGRHKIHSHEGETCLTFERLGDFKDGLFEMEDTSNEDDIDCLRIQATASQKHWLRIRRINIWAKKN
ncbi:alpha-1,3-mannosyl-glycoprotein 4-beta-N-acetylglucosaminyltransferase C-like [Elgaria multicarinata webbii]|uniref:alpha-1,3-mannosyl-glycoprotein 4-beta-N-acetylglucosaminyltransferase C-like n=1 Tax=Elgaria multicarinata webbii TaxID=159646 RepID=UPI002FCCDABA